jgi:RimJ/RimL family protein N-acetyltransferase
VGFEYQPTLQGPLIALRPLRDSDHDALFAVASDPLIWEQHPDKTRSQPDGFRRFFQQALDSGGALLASRAGTTEVIGSSRFHGYSAATSEVEIGWTFLGRPFWGGSYNREMKRLMVEHAFRFVGRVVFLIGPQNYRSQRAVLKIGAVRAGSRVDGAGAESYAFHLTPAALAQAVRR